MAGSWFSKITGTGMSLDSLEDLVVMQLADLYSAEDQLIAALPKMAAAASSAQLKNAFQMHLEETKRQRDRVEQAFRTLGRERPSETCEAMKGLITEGDEVISLDGDPKVKDAALIAAAQRVEHYEIAGYGCVRTFLQQLGRHDIADLLQQTLDEEGAADKKLTTIAQSMVNPQAATR